MTTTSLTFERVALQVAVGRLRAICRRNVAIPMSGSILVKASPANAWATFSATTSDCQLDLGVDGEIDCAMDLCVDAERLSQALAAPGESVKLTIAGERLRINVGRSVFLLPHMPSEGFPHMLAGKEDAISTFPCEWLPAALARVLPFTGDEGSAQMYARGPAIQSTGVGVTIVGTTGSMAATYTVTEDTPTEQFSKMLPRRVADALVDLPVKSCALRTGSAIFEGDDIVLTSKYVDAQMPDMGRVFPRGDKFLDLPRKDFTEAVKTVMPMAILGRHLRPVHIYPADGGTVVEAMAQDGQARVVIEQDSGGLDSHYDAGALLAMAEGDSDDVRLLWDAPTSLTVREGGFRAVIMHIRM